MPRHKVFVRTSYQTLFFVFSMKPKIMKHKEEVFAQAVRSFRLDATSREEEVLFDFI